MGAASLLASVGAAVLCVLVTNVLLAPTPPVASGGSKPLGVGLAQYTFFLQEDPSTSYFIVPALGGHGGFFGALVMIDQGLTLAPDRGSLLLGRGKGLAAFANDGPVGAPEILWTITFNDTRPFGFGKSSLSFRGSNNLGLAVRELAIVGGTGRFRLAQGFAFFSTYSRDPVTRFATTNITAFVQINPLYSEMFPELHDM